MRADRSFYAAVDAFVRVANGLRTDWMLIGAVPLAAWGQARASTDADFVVSLGLLGAWPLEERLSKAGFRKTAGPAQIPQSQLVVANYTFRKGRLSFKVDVFFRTTKWDAVALSRRLRVRIGARRYWVASAEDLLLYKITAYRKRDVDDAASIVDRSGDSMDWRYVWRWARKMGAAHLLRQLLLDMGRGR